MAREVLGLGRSHTGRRGRARTGFAASRAGQRDHDRLRDWTYLSHEIRTPLNSLLVLSQLLRDGLAGSLNPEQRRYVEIIERNGQHIIGLVDNVVELARLESGSLEVTMRATNLAAELRATVDTLAPLAQAKRLELVLETADDLPLVSCDPSFLRQVVINLVGNAIKFTERGRVTVVAEPAANLARVHVRDTGVGLSARQQPLVFEEFQRVAGPGAAPGAAGRGLGLFVARRLVQSMGGHLSLKSAVGEGSCFSFTLPTAGAGLRSADEAHGSNTTRR